MLFIISLLVPIFCGKNPTYFGSELFLVQCLIMLIACPESTPRPKKAVRLDACRRISALNVPGLFREGEISLSYTPSPFISKLCSTKSNVNIQDV
jgi:hypothetical protein